MAAIVESISVSQDAPVCLLPWQGNLYGLVSLWDMRQFSVADLVLILDHLAIFKAMLTKNPMLWLTGREQLQVFVNSISKIQAGADSIGLTSSATQARRVLAFWGLPPNQVSPADMIGHLEDLSMRVRDDLQERMFFCIDADKSPWIVKEHKPDPRLFPTLRLKNPTETFGSSVVERLKAIEPDLFEAIRGYVFGCNAACIFHLMRATEIAVPKIAALCELKDARPSWGSVLDQAEKYTQRTKYEDLPEGIKPHIEFLRTLVADMRSMQRAWRNKVIHVEDRILPNSAEVLPDTALSILSATTAFLQHLAESLPASLRS